MEKNTVECPLLAISKSASEDKQNLNVILVPESVLLALTKSSDGNPSEQNAISSHLKESDHETKSSSINFSNGGVSSSHQLAKESGNGQDVVVLESDGEWFVNADLSKALSDSSNGYVFQENPERLNAQHASETSRNVFCIQFNESREEKKTEDPSVKMHKCTVINCYKKFNTEDELKIHIEKHDKEPKVYQCPFPGCPWSFSTPYKLRRHASSHKQTKSFKCSYPGCDVSCSTKYNLRAHEQVHTSDNKSFCSLCNLSFSSKLKMLKHQRFKHEKKALVPCDYEGCDKMFHTLAGRNTHMKTHQRTNIVCDVEGCGKEFRKPSTYKDHFLTKHTQIRPFKCKQPNCNWEFTTSYKLKRHMLTHTDLKSWICPYENCSGRFHRKEHLKSHLKTHGADDIEKKKEDASDLDSPIKLSLEGTVYFFCPYGDCGSLFSSQGGAKQHILKMHSARNSFKSDTARDDPLSPTQVIQTQSALPKDSVNPSAVDGIGNAESSTTQTTSSSDSILRTLMEEGPSVNISASAKSIHNQIPCTNTSQLSEFSSTPSNQSSTHIDESQFLVLDTNGMSFQHLNETQMMQGGCEFVNIPNSTFTSTVATSAADQFLTFNDCIQTVDPNIVMAISSPGQISHLMDSRQKPASDCSDEEDAGGSGRGDLYEDTGGSARTDIHAYEKLKIRKQWKSDSDQSEEANKKQLSYNHYILQEPEVLSANQLDGKMSISVEHHFEGSTINLSDLA